MSKETFILNDDCLDIESSSLFFRRKMTYKYEVIEPRFGEGAIGDAGWSVLAGIFFWSGLVSLFVFIVVSYYYSVNKAQENEMVTSITSYKHGAYKDNRNGYYTD